ncbi:hypothetical protein RHOFW104T7_02865 [Rhodanobacter thiooxydans]|uniref:Uncharacterized protein n=1 Tax=Rhodanobacter thiooxydans TaxID=416169 RepID=A0A154QCR5_9GAMM|nr:hypothetical protein UUA_02041 [Rhodanobacter thiooxydans LCS2]KZC22014.1 hypothetical protein RHOFW104T7_02865 [Rhodanobacter thiooxydans]
MGGMLDPWQQLEHWADRHTTGICGEARLLSARADSVRQAIRLSEGLAVYWIPATTGHGWHRLQSTR